MPRSYLGVAVFFDKFKDLNFTKKNEWMYKKYE